MPKTNKKKSKKKMTKFKKLIRNIKKNNLKFNLSEVIIIVIVSLMLGAIVGGTITYDKENITITKVPTELEELVNTYNNISNNYYKKVNKTKLIDAAIEGMINSLDDPYSIYMNEDDTDTFNEAVDGKYIGIGASITIDGDYIKIVAMFNNSPVKKAGMEIGDKIIEVDGVDIKGKSTKEVTSLVKGKDKTSVTIKALRDDKEMTFKLKRSNIDIPSVTSKIIEKNNKKVGYISIDIFASNTYDQFYKKLKKIEKKKIDSLIIDVRSNPGGHLDQVTKILEMFLSNDKIIYQIKTQDKVQKIYSTTKEKRDYPIAVLINKSSASASEILASAIKEVYNGKIVGVNSYGKGTVQKAYELSDGTSLKYTTQKWLTPKGNWINEKGVTPDEKVELNDEYKANPTEENDNQFQKALEIVTK